MLNSDTAYGKVAGVQFKDGERYYFMIKQGVVSYMPATAVEDSNGNTQNNHN